MFLTRLTSSLTQLTRTDISASLDRIIWETTPECEYLVFDEFGDLVTYDVVSTTNPLEWQTYNIRCIVPLSTEDGNLLATEDGNLVGLLGDSLV